MIDPNDSGSPLFARPSFFEGMARIFDFSGSLNEYNQMSDEDLRRYDAEKLRQDWEKIMGDGDQCGYK